MGDMDYCVLDIETYGGQWKTFPEGFSLLLTGIKHRDNYFMFTGHKASLTQMADFLENFDGVVVTFNGDRFDLPILSQYVSELTGKPLFIKRHFDLLKAIELKSHRRISLDKLSRYTFGGEKVPWDHRTNLTVWNTNPYLLVEYNRVDLDLTDDLFRRILSRRHLFLGDSTILVDPPLFG